MKNKDIPWHCIIKSLKNEALSECEQRELQLWLNCNDNGKLYENIKSVWNEILKKSQDEPDVKRCKKELYDRIRRKQHKKTFKINTYNRVAAILVVALTVGFYYFRPATQQEKHTNVKEQEQVNAEPAVISATNGKTKLVLPDSSVVWLNAGSTLAHNGNFGRDHREVRITGEAYFEVIKNHVAFLVSMGDVTVKVHGTKFNVNATDEAKTRVSLNEGSVELITPSGSNYIVPGQLAVYDKGLRRTLMAESDVELECCWAKEQIVFEQASLGKVCQYLSKRYNIYFDVPQSIAEKFSYTFTLKDESVKDILMLMETIHPLEFNYKKRE